ncbi:MAG: LPS export ABC transporter periplasmic protein LptC [Flammeovirgaceae bacterium]
MTRILLLILCCSACLFACESPQTNSNAVTTVVEEVEEYTGPVLTFSNIETFYSQNAQVKLRLVAPTQWHMQNSDEVFPDGVHITFFDKDNQEKTTLVSDSARYIAEIKTYHMVGNVEVHNMVENQTLETPILNLDERSKEIFTDTTLKITTEKELIYGIGLRAKQDFSQYKIAKPTGIFSIDTQPTN